MTTQNDLIFEDMIEKLELFERKLNILEDLINYARLNYENKKNSRYELKFIFKEKKIVKKKRKKKKAKVPFNNFVIDTEDECSDSE